jgi:uncharacterized protein DUF5655
MGGRECHHCKQWIEQGEAHDCWATTDAALTRDLPEDLREAWDQLRDTAAGFGQQRIYASGHAIMFARKTCYFFVRPKRRFLEVCVFLGRTITASQVRRVDQVSKSKLVHIIRITGMRWRRRSRTGCGKRMRCPTGCVATGGMGGLVA